jgi:Domain of unknown function (DUF4262)
MLQDFRWPTPKDPADEKIVADIREQGCHIVGILPDEKGPQYAFSIGLFLNYGQPEVVLFGLRPQQQGTLINDVRDHAARGERFVAGDRTDKFLMNFDVCFLDVPLDAYRGYLGTALWFYQSLPTPFPCVQMVWPDRDGKFPWEPGYDKQFDAVQPLLASIN